MGQVKNNEANVLQNGPQIKYLWYISASFFLIMTTNMSKPSQLNKSLACNIFELPHYFWLDPYSISVSVTWFLNWILILRDNLSKTGNKTYSTEKCAILWVFWHFLVHGDLLKKQVVESGPNLDVGCPKWHMDSCLANTLREDIMNKK